MSPRVKLILYWVTTIFTSLNFALGGVLYFGRTEQVLQGLAQLGYPAYVASILGFWKALAAIALVWPRTPLLKEWTYAGIVFNLTGAAASNAFAGAEAAHVISPIVGLLIAGASWALRPEERRLTAAK